MICRENLSNIIFIIAWFLGYEAEQLLTYELTFNLTMFTVANVWLELIKCHSSVPLSSPSEDSLSSTGVGMLFASSTKSPQFLTPNPLVFLCFALPKNHKMAAMWEHIPKTLAPALHLQYHAVTLASLYFIHSWYDRDDTCRLCNRTLIRPGSSLWTCIWQLPSKCSCA